MTANDDSDIDTLIARYQNTEASGLATLDGITAANADPRQASAACARLDRNTTYQRLVDTPQQR